ncbi:MAG: hypothetical protein JJ900_03520 [Rhodospirillales bacterium]|nr:hypothetical protein [Rhodospirillales bacterium]MBO6785895.1 hypothetical protein [Rhodospirillales bacterium]
MKLPLRITVTTAFAVFTAATIAAVAIPNYLGSRDVIIETAKSGIVKSADAAEQGIERLLGRAFLAADTIASLPAETFEPQNRQALLSLLTVSQKNSPEIYGVFVGLADGSFVQALNLVDPNGTRRAVEGMPEAAAAAWRTIGPAAGGRGRPERWWHFDADHNALPGPQGTRAELSTYDPRTRDWFINAQKRVGGVVSNAYIFASLKKPGVTVAEPLANAPGSTVGVDLSLSDLAEVTHRLRPGDNGVVAILNEANDVLAYPDPQKILKKIDYGLGVELIPVSELADDRVRAALSAINGEDQTHRSFSVGGKEYIGFVRNIDSKSLTSWKIVSVAAVDDFTGGLKDALRGSLIVAGSVLVVAVGLVAMMSGWITVPVVRIREMADRVTQLELQKPDTFESPFTEIKRLQLSMERMRIALDMFLRFVPRDVVRQLIRADKAAKVGGTRSEVTLLFTDIEGFTSVTENMTPEQVMSQLEEYFELISFGIQSNMGTIDKFIGDAVMAMWNAPTEDVFHVDNACRGTLTALHISQDLNKRFVKNGLAPLRTRFGLHTCEALVGNIGAPDRMQYTCLGSGVNLAARMEGLNKFYGTQVLVSDAVRRKASPEFLFRRVDIVEAKGTSVPVTIYELMGQRGENAAFYVGDRTIQAASKYEQAFDFYVHRDFADALRILNDLAEYRPDDKVVQQLREKCKTFAEVPPDGHWTGTTKLDEK